MKLHSRLWRGYESPDYGRSDRKWDDGPAIPTSSGPRPTPSPKAGRDQTSNFYKIAHSRHWASQEVAKAREKKRKWSCTKVDINPQKRHKVSGVFGWGELMTRRGVDNSQEYRQFRIATAYVGDLALKQRRTASLSMLIMARPCQVCNPETFFG